jgi:hypothetical protein
MVSKFLLATAAALTISLSGGANAAGLPVKAPPAVAPPVALQDCSAFYDDYQHRGFGWGHGPGSSLGIGGLEGALPRYVYNEFPNWYGLCADWGPYNASSTAFW